MSTDWQFPGSRWWKCDLHLHSPASYDFKNRETVTPEEWVTAVVSQGLEIVDVRQGPTTSESSYIYGYHNGGSFPGWVFAGDADWFVTHLDVSRAQAEEAAAVLARALAS